MQSLSFSAVLLSVAFISIPLCAQDAPGDDTKPYSVPDPLMAEARSFLGKDCTVNAETGDPVLQGFKPAPKFLPMITHGATVVVREKDGTRFAYLLTQESEGDICEIADVVALPPVMPGDDFLRCKAADPPAEGIAIRRAKTRPLEAYWEIDLNANKLTRVSLAASGIENSLRCRQPQIGD